MGRDFNRDATAERAASAPGEAQRILVVDDDERIRRVLRDALEAGGFSIAEACCQSEVMAALKAGNIGLITLDLSLRHEDGLAIARTIRRISRVPIVMVTARADDVDRIVGLELGADDYIVKPFNVREVLARVRAVLRRTGGVDGDALAGDTSEVVHFSGFVFNVGAHTLQDADGKLVPLTTAEFRMLHVFVTHPGRVLSRNALLDLAGGVDAEALERSIDSTVSRLRRKIEQNASQPLMIKTMRGAGYVFTPKISVRR